MRISDWSSDVCSSDLLTQRPPGKKLAGMWEFPGGKVEPNETPEAALLRELREELDLDISAACLAPYTFASQAYDDFHLLMQLYVCRRWAGQPSTGEGQAMKWVRPQKMGDQIGRAHVGTAITNADFV